MESCAPWHRGPRAFLATNTCRKLDRSSAGSCTYTERTTTRASDGFRPGGCFSQCFDLAVLGRAESVSTVDRGRRRKRIHRSGHRETDLAECADGGSDDRGGRTDVNRTRCVLCRDRALEWNSLVSLGLQFLVCDQPNPIRAASDPGGTHHQSKREGVDRSRVPGWASCLDGPFGRCLCRSSAPWLRCDRFPAGLAPWIRLVCDRVQTARDSGSREERIGLRGHVRHAPRPRDATAVTCIIAAALPKNSARQVVLVPFYLSGRFHNPDEKTGRLFS